MTSSQNRAEFELLSQIQPARAVGCATLALLLVIVGPALTLAGPAVPFATLRFLEGLFGHSAPVPASAVTAVSAVLHWLAAAAVVAFGGLMVAGQILRWRSRVGTLVVGADGVATNAWFSLRREFVPWQRVTDVRLAKDAVELVLDDEGTRSLLVKQPEVASRVCRERWERYRATPKTDRLRVLSYDEPESWEQRARAATQGDDYRQESRAPDLLLRVAEDPAQSPEQRVGAALALSEATPELKQRVRVAIDETAERELAEAMEAALDGRAQEKRLRKLLSR